MRWADWLNVGDGSGYPTVSVLHESWSPPSPGQTATIKASSATDARQTHLALLRLTIKLQRVAFVHYIKRGCIEHQAAELGCQPNTVHQRVERLHAALGAELCNNHSVG